ncbi:hypothetical protein TPA0910_43650 [Streptomyces hygroscopicus subsp. sporocinereus]|uniref:Cytokinin dehydrogenase 1 FAD/cytokinin binding domain-containing protein n=2 Tax=Streptomyces hygroscopicus TaxID=1912 RepID=A0ABQ3U2V5_STRHY|nr:hypothetical protein TPA0910_43650 [Streptomyces hygroscopicus]
MRDHVIYESRLELARLLFDDFDPSVRRILAQPFLLKAEVEGKVRKHIPDYLLISEDGPVVVDVKPRHRVAKPEVAFTFDWTRRLQQNRWLYDRAVEMGAKRYLFGAVPNLTTDDWRRHFGTFYSTLSKAKQSFDPGNVLTPGQGFFG